MSADLWVQILCGVFTAGSVLGGVKVSITQLKETQKQLVQRLDSYEVDLRGTRESVRAIEGTLKTIASFGSNK